MSCLCYICKAGKQVPTHINFKRSKFTNDCSYGLLHIKNVSVSIPAVLRFKINKTQAAWTTSILKLPTWTIEDYLFIEAYDGSLSGSLIGTGSLQLAQEAFDNSEVQSNLDSLIEQEITVNFTIDYESRYKQGDNFSYMLFRKTLKLDSNFKYTLEVVNGEKTEEFRLKDESGGYKEEIWHHVCTIDSFAVLSVNFKMENLSGAGRAKNFDSNARIELTDVLGIPYFFTVRSPSIKVSSFISFYLVPFTSQYISSPTSSMTLKLLPNKNN